MHAVPFADQKIKKIAMYAGCVALAAGIGMAFEYGRAMSWLHAVSLSLLAIGGSLAFLGSDLLRAAGRPLAPRIIAGLGIILLAGEYGTHFGYTVGHRVRDTQETGVQNTNYKDAQDNKASERVNLDMWREQLKNLLAQNAWAPTVKADAMRDELNAMDEAIRQEAARVRCADRCLQLKFKRAELEKKIGIAEQAADLSKRIEATQRILDKKTETAGKTEFRSSKIVNQTTAFAQLATWDDKPSDTAMSWTQLVLGAIIAALTTFLAPFFFAIAFSDIRQAARPTRAIDVGGLSALDANLGTHPSARALYLGSGPAGLRLTKAA
jgi:ribosomal protein L37AE/L43A